MAFGRSLDAERGESGHTVLDKRTTRGEPHDDRNRSSQSHVHEKIYIGGEWVKPSGAGTLEVINATTEQVMGSVPEGNAEDVDRAVAAARSAFASWSETSVEERGELDAADRRGARRTRARRSRR